MHTNSIITKQNVQAGDQRDTLQLNERSEPVCISVQIDKKAFRILQRLLTIFLGLSFHVWKKEFISIIGPSGCGKTTLLRMIAGLDNDYEGHIHIDGRSVVSPSGNRGLVFQESRLLPWYRVEKNISFALPTDFPEKERSHRISEILKLVGLSDFSRAWPFQLSGGMQKRVALARALVNLPKILLLDEPFSALDTFIKYKLQENLEKIHAESELTTLLVTHDIDEAVYLSDRILLLPPNPEKDISLFDVQLPRPRIRTSPGFVKMRSTLLSNILW